MCATHLCIVLGLLHTRVARMHACLHACVQPHTHGSDTHALVQQKQENLVVYASPSVAGVAAVTHLSLCVCVCAASLPCHVCACVAVRVCAFVVVVPCHGPRQCVAAVAAALHGPRWTAASGASTTWGRTAPRSNIFGVVPLPGARRMPVTHARARVTPAPLHLSRTHTHTHTHTRATHAHTHTRHTHTHVTRHTRRAWAFP
jgi:hypothetical protein